MPASEVPPTRPILTVAGPFRGGGWSATTAAVARGTTVGAAPGVAGAGLHARTGPTATTRIRLARDGIRRMGASLCHRRGRMHTGPSSHTIRRPPDAAR